MKAVHTSVLLQCVQWSAANQQVQWNPVALSYSTAPGYSLHCLHGAKLTDAFIGVSECTLSENEHEKKED